MPEKTIGKRIQKLRKEKGYTQAELAEIIDISTHHMSSFERGVYNIKLSKLVQIMNILDCTADDIFCDVIKTGHRHKEGVLSEEIAKLPQKEQEKIFAVVETMIEYAKKN
ncbi:MAG: helix-turn-helix transcriptional regulator [Ruminococcaceae bacterium]|nr:helix-turn-helix transcriptional regulator [Oscillospiraceae bacterium]